MPHNRTETVRTQSSFHDGERRWKLQIREPDMDFHLESVLGFRVHVAIWHILLPQNRYMGTS